MTDGTEAAQALRSMNRKVITLPNAKIDITIIAITVDDFIEARGELDIPTGALLKMEEDERVAKIAEAMRDPKQQRRYTDFFLRRGVLVPSVVTDPKAELAEDEIYVTDFGRDRNFVIASIIEFSGFGEDAEVVYNFREEVPADDADDRPDGEAVREAPA